MKKFYLTTTLPYVNDIPHVGHMLEFIHSDVLARYFRIKKGVNNVWLNIGLDEHGQKNATSAEKKGISPKEYVDNLHTVWKDFSEKFDISFNTFYRTSDSRHYKSASVFWNTCLANGYIYKKKYSGKYCLGCEEFKLEKNLVGGKCTDHPTKELLWIEEENYFFKLSEFKDILLNYYQKNPNALKPEKIMPELINWIKNVEDISISRSRENLSWGIPVPGDDTQVMYVWFDALTNYINVLGYGTTDGKTEYDLVPRNTPEEISRLAGKQIEEFDKESLGTYRDWDMHQSFGVDNLRFQASLWQAMLFSVGEANTNKLLRHGFILDDKGIKISKSLGNVISPFEILEKYNSQAIRFYVTAVLQTYSDSPFISSDLENSFNATIANNFGNLLNRVVVLAKKKETPINNYGKVEVDFKEKVDTLFSNYENKMDDFELNQAFQELAKLSTYGNEYITLQAPWDRKNDGSRIEEILNNLSYLLSKLIVGYYPVIPDIAIKAEGILTGKIQSQILVERIEVEKSM